MEKLKEMRNNGANLVFYGDDGEKFGVWPGTRKLCYEDGWLDRFFSEVESADWLDSCLPSESAETEADGPFYIPASSYTEMGEWALHGIRRAEYDDLRQKLDAQEKSDIAEVFLSGGFWRNFLSIYPESKELQGRILSAEALVRESENTEALHHFWRSQCNCAFWHGVFGGIYLPHLREAVWKELSRAEWDALNTIHGYPLIKTEDVNADGHDETVIISRTLSLLIHPDYGLTASELTFLHPDGEPVPLGHVLTRQREEYHDSIPETGSSVEAKTIHDGLASKEKGLAGKVTIDRWRRMCFTDLVMSSSTDWNSWKHCDGEIVHFQKPSLSSSRSTSNSEADLKGEFNSGELRVKKRMRVGLNKPVIKTDSVYSIGPGDRAGMEICLNLMTGQSPDRYFKIDSGENHLMSFEGEFRSSRIDVFDCGRKVRTIIEMNRETAVWVTPLNSVNRSESGYESVHQGAAFYISDIADETGSFDLEISLRMEALNDS
jgi:alpha-amylase